MSGIYFFLVKNFNRKESKYTVEKPYKKSQNAKNIVLK